jgi:hypothetical protein
MVAHPLHWSLVRDLAFTQQDTRTGVIIIVVHKDTFIGEVMITDIILTDLISVRRTTTSTNTTIGNDITTVIGDIAINFC